MADIFDEVDEDLKRDQMQLLWKRYGKIVLTAVAAVVLGVGIRQGYSVWKTNQKEASATTYQQALKSDDIISFLQADLDKMTDGYAMLAKFEIASEQVANGNFEAAESTYLGLASDSDLDPLYQQAALLLSVMAAPEKVDVVTLSERLFELETLAGPWQAMALETSAGLALRVGDHHAALAKYKNIIGMTDIPAGLHQRAERMVEMLASD